MKPTTDIEQVKSVARALLMTEVYKTPYSPMVVQHPFTSSGFVATTKDGVMQLIDITESEENLQAWQSFMRKQINSTDNAYEIYMMTNKPYSLTFLKYASPYLSKADFSKILADAWIRSENPNCDTNVSKSKLAEILDVARNLDRYELATQVDDASQFFKSYLMRHMDKKVDPKWLDTLLTKTEGQELAERLGATFTDYGVVSARDRSLYEPITRNNPIMDEKFDLIEVNGQQALFPNGIIKTENIPKGLYKYDLRGGEIGDFLTIEPIVRVNRSGTILVKEPFEFDGKDHIPLTGETSPNFLCEEVTPREFLNGDYEQAEAEEMDIKMGGLRYIKTDYNDSYDLADSESGTANGLRENYRKIAEFYKNVKRNYPDLLTETCASGGKREDGFLLKHFDVQSVSDQEEYPYYPSIICGSLVNNVPEKTGVWCMPYPVRHHLRNAELDEVPAPSDEEVIFNVVNGLTGVVTLSSRVDRLNRKQTALLKEGLTLYPKIFGILKTGYPSYPLGLTRGEDTRHALRFESDRGELLFLWAIGENRFEFDGAGAYRQIYPSKADCEIGENSITLKSGFCARIFIKKQEK